MKSNKQDTFLLGHARRMRECRKRQRQQNSEAYRNRVNTQKREHRLHPRSKALSHDRTKQKLQSIVNTRQTNRERQRRYRLNLLNEKKRLQQEKDRNYRRLKRKLQQTDHSIGTFENEESTLCTIPKPIMASQSMETFYYRFPLNPKSEIFRT